MFYRTNEYLSYTHTEYALRTHEGHADWYFAFRIRGL